MIQSMLIKNSMESLSNYQKKVFSVIHSLWYNLHTDYEGQYTQENAQNVLGLYLLCYFQQNPIKRIQNYRKLKQEQIQDQNQLKILEWLEKERGRKYMGQNLPGCQTRKKNKSIDTCPNPDFLQQTRVIGLSENIYVLQKVSLDPVQISQSVFMILTDSQSQKCCLFRKVRDRQERPTPWIVQKTKDYRYIWRATTGIDRNDVGNLLRFILLKRMKNDQCPSIFINTGSHGDVLGYVSSDTGDFRLTAKFIWEQTMNTLFEMIETYGSKLRVNKSNIRTKVCINFMSSSYPSIYPDRADHIIDTQCFGAFRSIKAQRLHPPKTLVKQEDLTFLEGRLQAEIQQVLENQKQFQNLPQKEQQANNDSLNENLKEINIIPIKKILQDSKIINNEVDAYILTNFFQFTYFNEWLDTQKRHKRLKNLRLLFRASEHNFSLKQYFQICGEQKQTFFLCLTEKDKIIGAYSPCRHFKNQSLWDILFSQENKDGKFKQDPQKDSFIFSVTNNEVFMLDNADKAIYRKRDKSQIIFGDLDFSICDRANIKRQSLAINNLAYKNPSYKSAKVDQPCVQSCLRFNGNEGYYFLLKQWQVWKIQLQEYQP